MNYYNEYDPLAAAWLRELINQKLIPAGDVDARSILDVTPNELRKYTQCHFFAGIAGWSLALKLARWPDDRPVWTGSCPCQPFSSAGKQLGQADERHLWPAFFELIRECRPDVVFGEQVASAAVVGKVGGGTKKADPVWVDGIFDDMEGAGYSCGSAVLAASSVGSPQIRQRLYWVAESNSGRERGGNIAGLGTPRSQVAEQEDGANPANQSGNGSQDDERLADAHELHDDRARPRPGDNCGERQSSCPIQGQHDLWQRVVHSSECDEYGNCPVCLDIDFADCACPGPTQDDIYEYDERPDGLYARRVGLCECEGLEGHAGNVLDGCEPRRVATYAGGPTPTAGSDCWANFDLIPCADGKTRRIESGLAPLVAGLPRGMVPSGDPSQSDAQASAEGRVMRLKGYGNSIVPALAAEFIGAFLDVTE